MNFIDYKNFLNKNNPYIVQIGAHDGVLGEEYGFQEFLESIKNFKLILVEPLSPYFDNLVNVYGKYKDNVCYCKHAISNIDGETKMVEQGCMSYLSPTGHIPIQSKTWNTFVNHMNIDAIDLLLLDCEGYEFEIIKHINFDIIKPSIIRYEYKHIQNKEDCDNFLLERGYSINYCTYDPTYNKVAIL